MIEIRKNSRSWIPRARLDPSTLLLVKLTITKVTYTELTFQLSLFWVANLLRVFHDGETDGARMSKSAQDRSGGGGYDRGPVQAFLSDALTATRDGKALKTAESKACGCSAKYAR